MGLDGQTLFIALVVTSAFAGVLLLWVWSARAIFYSLLCVLATVAIAREFLAIVDPLPWRIPLAGLMFVHAAFFAMRLVSLLGTARPRRVGTRSGCR